MKKKEIVVLMGYSGVGKSVVGSALAQKLRYKWVDCDIYLHDVLKFLKKESYSKEEFKRKKELELEILKFVLGKEKVVYSAGEGLLVNQSKENLIQIQNLLEGVVNVILLYREGEDLEVFKGIYNRKICVDDLNIDEIVEKII